MSVVSIERLKKMFVNRSAPSPKEWEALIDTFAGTAVSSGGVHKTYADNATLQADQANQIVNALYHVIDYDITVLWTGGASGVLKSDYKIIGGQPEQRRYTTLADKYADQDNQWPKFFYYVQGSTDEIQTWFLYLGTTNGDATDYGGGGGVLETEVEISMSDYTTALSIGTNKGYWLVPWNCTVVDAIGSSIAEAPVGGDIVYDLNKNGATMMVTDKITIEAGAKSSIGATTQPVFTTTALLKGDIVTADIDSVGAATTEGKGASIILTVTLP